MSAEEITRIILEIAQIVLGITKKEIMEEIEEEEKIGKNNRVGVIPNPNLHNNDLPIAYYSAIKEYLLT